VAFAAGAADWYISGSPVSGWTHCKPGCEFTATATDGVFELKLDELSGEFLLVQGTPNNPDWSTKLGGNGSKLKEGVAYNLVSNGQNISVDGKIANATLTLDTNNKTITVTGAAAENDYSTVYLVGDMGAGWNESTTDYPLTLKAGTDNVWTGKYNLTAATSYFKMKAGNYVYGTGGNDIAVVLGTEYTASQSGNAFSIKAGEYTFTFVLDKNADSGVLTVTGDNGGEDPDPDPDPDPTVDYSSWWVNVLYDSNDWKDNGVQPTAEGLSVHNDLPIGTDNFKVKIWDGKADIWYSTGTAIPQNEWVKIDGNSDTNMTIAGATAGQKFNVEFNCATSSIKVTPEGGEDPEPPVPADYPELYFLGGNNNWTASAASLMTCNDGVYTYTIAKLTDAFKIATADWAADNSWTSDDLAMAIDTDYTCITRENSPNMGMAQKLTDATITFDYATKTLRVTGTVDETPDVYTYSINSDLTETTWSMEAMTEDADAGTWSYIVTPIADEGQMQVVAIAGDKKVYMGSEATISVENPEVTMAAGASNLKYTLTAGTEYKFTFDPETNTLKVTTTAEPPVPVDYPELYFLGGDNNWTASAASLMTCTDGVYTYTIAKLTAAFKIATADWAADNSWTSDNLEMAIDTDYTCITRENSPNMGMAQKLTDATITFDYATKTIRVTGTVDETPATVTYVLKGTFSDPAWASCEMTAAEDGTYIYECQPAAATGTMLAVRLEDGIEKAWYKAAADDVLNANSSVTLSTSGAGDLNYDFTGFDKVKFVFDPATGLLSSTGTTGISDIEAGYDTEATYYTLQGVRVDGTPAPGMYIVVRGTKATKEYVK